MPIIEPDNESADDGDSNTGNNADRDFFVKKCKRNDGDENGAIVTSTTELVTVVYLREAIHRAKCMARKAPEQIANKISRRCRWSSSFLPWVKAKGVSIKTAIHKR